MLSWRPDDRQTHFDNLHAARMDDWMDWISATRPLGDTQADALHTSGFVVIPGPVPSDRLSSLVAAYDDVMTRGHGTADHKVGSTTTRLFDLVNAGAPFDPLYVFPPLLDACSRTIGGPFKLTMLLGRTLRPNTAAQELHVDLARDDPARPMVGFILMLDEFRPDNGATRMVPGSHRWSGIPEQSMVHRREALPDEVLATGPAGSLIIFDASIWHGHAANSSNAPRRSIQGYFLPRGAHSGFDLPSRMLPDTIARLGPLARWVLALDGDSTPPRDVDGC
jgi:hypothetical protein